MTEPSTGWQLDDITYSGGTQDGPRAKVKLSRAEEQVHAEGSGTGLILSGSPAPERPSPQPGIGG